MTYREMVTFMVFIIVIFLLALALEYIRNQEKALAIDFIELPIPVTVNPDLT